MFKSELHSHILIENNYCSVKDDGYGYKNLYIAVYFPVRVSSVSSLKITITMLPSSIIFYILFLFLAAPSTQYQDKIEELPQTSAEASCPIWMKRNHSSGLCECGDDLQGIVKCDGVNRIFLQACYCMTPSVNFTAPIVGHCIQTCYTIPQIKLLGRRELGDNGTECEHFNRMGQLCSECKKGYGLPVYSYIVDCVECVNYKYNWLKYIAICILPLTALYIIIVLSMSSVTSGSMVAFVTISQMITSSTILKTLFTYRPNKQNFYTKLVVSVLAIWNLDMFKAMYKPFCLSPHWNIFHVYMLDYLVGIYPILLIVVTYCVITLHGKFQTVVFLCRPFNCIVRIYRREWNVQGSLLNAFCTFFVLSYMKILNVSSEILASVKLYNMDNKQDDKTYLYYNSSMVYFGKEHLPYAIFALIMMGIFNVFPIVLLFLYPSKRFQQCLNRFKLKRRMLHMIMDIFHGCYKTSPRDYRHFTTVYFLLRILNVAMLLYIKGLAYFVLLAYTMIFVTVILAFTRPYRTTMHTTIDMTLFLIAGCGLFIMPSATTMQIYDHIDPNPKNLIDIVPLIPFVYAVIYFCYVIFPKKLFHRLKEYLLQVNCIIFLIEKFSTTEELEESLPHRLQQCNEYTHLLHATK